MTDTPALPSFVVLLNSLEGKYQNDVLRGITTTLAGKARLIVVVTDAFSTEHAERDRQSLLERLPRPSVVRGVVVLSGSLRLGREDIEKIATVYGRECVISVGLEVDKVLSIVVDDESGVRDAVEHLVKHGCQNIGFLRGPEGNDEAERRLRAYRAAIANLPARVPAQAGAPPGDQPDLVSDPGPFSFAHGQAAAGDLLSAGRSVDGLVAANDEIARGALAAIKQRLSGPPVSVIGFDDANAGASTPPLTTVRQPLEHEGQLAARWLLAMHEGKALPGAPVRRLRTVLQIRRSCGCPEEDASERLRQERAWLVQLFPSNEARAEFEQARRRFYDIAGRTTFADLEAQIGRILAPRLLTATSTDSGVWHNALLGLGAMLVRSLQGDDPRRLGLEELFGKLLKRIADRGAEIALQDLDRQAALRSLREDLRRLRGYASLELALRKFLRDRYWIRLISDTTDDPTPTTVCMGSDRTAQFDESSVVPDGTTFELVASFPIDCGNVRGHMVFELGPPSTWRMFGELASVVREFLRDNPSVYPSRPGAVPSEAAPDTIGTFEEFENRAKVELEKLRVAVPFATASLQLVEGDRRSIVLKLGFDDESPTLLRPVSCDRLVQEIFAQQRPRFIDDTHVSSADWHSLPHVRGWIGAPIVHQGNTIGLLTLDFPEPAPDSELKYGGGVRTLVEELGPLLAAARSHFREHQLAERTRLVLETMNLLEQQLEETAVLQRIPEKVTRHLNCSHCTLFLKHKENNEEFLRAEYTSNSETRGRKFRREQGYAGIVWHTGEGLRIKDVTGDPRFDPPETRSVGKRSMLVVPIKFADQVIGVISADQDTTNWFTESDAQVVAGLAQQAALAIQRSKAVKFVKEIAGSILAERDRTAILPRVVECAVELTNANDGIIYHLTPDKRGVQEAFPPNSQYHPPPRLDNPEGLTCQIIAKREWINVEDVKSDKRVNPLLRVDNARWRSLTGGPLIIGKEVVGVLFVNDEDRHVFSDFERSLLSVLADLAAVALERAAMLDRLDAIVGTSPKRKCFVMMPFSSTNGTNRASWDEVFTSIKGAVGRSRLYTCVRADPPAGGLVDNLIPELLSADIAIADLSEGRANVFYELGLRHAEGGLTLLITQDDHAPVDVGDVWLRYEPTREGLRTLEQQLEVKLKELEVAIANGRRDDFAPSATRHVRQHREKVRESLRLVPSENKARRGGVRYRVRRRR